MTWSRQELIELARQSYKTIVACAVTAVIGTIVIAVATSFVRASRAGQAIADAERTLRNGGQPPKVVADTLDQLLRYEHWVVPHPNLRRQLACAAVKCLVRIGDVDAAVERARNQAAMGADASGVQLNPASLRVWPVNQYLAKAPSGQALTKWSAYEVLIKELRSLGQHADVLKKLEQEVPAEVFGAPPKQAAEPPKPPPPEKAAEPPPAVVASEPPPPEKTDHCDLAERHVAQKKWDDAIRECDLALEADPKDSRAITLKKIARNRGQSWAVVRTSDAKAYTSSGAALPGRINAGALVEISDIKKTRSGSVAVCELELGGNKVPGILIPTKDLDVSDGPLSQANEEEKKLKVRQAQLLNELYRIRNTGSDSNNPHAGEYNAAKTAYNEFWINVKALTAKRDEAKGDARMKYADELHQLKGKDVKLAQDVEAAKKKYKEWEEAHPSEQSDASKLNDIETELAGVQDRLGEIAEQAQ